MIIIVEPNKDIKKKLCDLVSRERVFSVTAIPDLLEALCRFRTHIDVIVVNAVILNELLTNEVLPRLCQKLAIEHPPVLGYFTNGQRQVKHKLEATYEGLSFIEYDENQAAFPDQYIAALRELYPAVNVDLDRARHVWQDETADQELIDIGEWLQEEGFLDTGVDKEPGAEVKGTAIPSGTTPMAQGPAKQEARPAAPEADYKQLYLELKKKYDELVKYVNDLVDSVEESDNDKNAKK